MVEISVIVPVYRVEPYLRRCLDSILAQMFKDFELIIVDDGSPDRCPAICDEYAEKDSRIAVIHQENGGVSAARNAGVAWALANSNSRWLAFIDGDDWVHPEYLQFLRRAAAECSAGISACAHKLVSEYETPQPQSFNGIRQLTFDEFFSYRKDNINIVTPWGKLYRKAYFQDIRYPVGRINEDLFTTHILLAQSPSIALVEQELYYYFVNPNSIMRQDWSPARLNEIQGYEELIAFTRDHNFPGAYIRSVESYFRSLDKQIKQLTMPENRAYRKYLIQFRKQLRSGIRKYRHDVPVSLSQRHWLLEDAYPNIMRIYWLSKAVGRRIRGNK